MELFPITEEMKKKKKVKLEVAFPLPRMHNLPGKFTPAQKRVYKSLKIHGGFLKHHLRPNGKECYRFLDSDNNPLENFRYAVVKRMIDKLPEDLYVSDGHIIRLV